MSVAVETDTSQELLGSPGYLGIYQPHLQLVGHSLPDVDQPAGEGEEPDEVLGDVLGLLALTAPVDLLLDDGGDELLYLCLAVPGHQATLLHIDGKINDLHLLIWPGGGPAATGGSAIINK